MFGYEVYCEGFLTVIQIIGQVKIMTNIICLSIKPWDLRFHIDTCIMTDDELKHANGNPHCPSPSKLINNNSNNKKKEKHHHLALIPKNLDRSSRSSLI